MANKNTRKVYLDFLKIIAIYMVIFNHTSARGFVLFTVRRGSPFFIFYLFNAIFIKIAVPLFFMASGAILIGKKETLKRVITNRFLKYLFLLLVASLIQYLYSCNKSSQSFSLSSFFTKVYTDRFAVAYWYLYTYLAYILLLPLLRRLANAMTTHEYYWMIVLYGLFRLISIIDFLIWKGDLSHNSHFYLFITDVYVFYPLTGFFIDQKMEKKYCSWKTVGLLSLVSIISIIVCCLLTIYKCSLIDEWIEQTCQSFFNTLIFIPSITVFLAAKTLFQNHKPKEKICNVITVLGGLTFGIYLVENILRKETEQVFIFLEPYIKTLPACWVWILVVCLLGAAIVAVIKRIPGVNKFI